MLKIGNGYSSVWIYHAGSAQWVPEPTRYPTFFRYLIQISFENSEVTGNPKYWVLPEIVGISQYFQFQVYPDMTGHLRHVPIKKFLQFSNFKRFAKIRINFWKFHIGTQGAKKCKIFIPQQNTREYQKYPGIPEIK